MIISYSIILALVAIKKSATIVSEIKRTYSILRIIPENSEQLQFLSKLYLTDDEMADFWKAPTKINETIYVMINPGFINKFDQLLGHKSIPYHIEVNDYAHCNYYCII
ncbi:hypothetical protein LOAG_09177 [Loa loa]|uniref:Carboxypeptidase activation peptide domain-containing protein n=1 Tax=Loa loa TaxID=7209 RepID=A0A1S0TSD8_LOALO|nr:hypothetical protein LOAG_09177 [Loa loa]EFO19315.1 hypothetical protein LOAG_09177 [Loa loa]